MKIHVGPMKLPVSHKPEDSIGDIRLRLYQSQLRYCNDRFVLLDAPPSSGKTLAYLIRAIEARGIQPRFRTTIIIYPTNALLWDQAFSLRTLITQKLGKKVNLTVESDEDIRWRTEDPNADVDLYVLNGETLAALSQESKSTEGRAIIEQLRRNQAEARIILTNPEILYYMFLYRFAKTEDLIESIFQTKAEKNLLVFDEFHLYYGYSLTTITYMLAYMEDFFDQIIFSSATPIDIKSIIHGEYQQISANPSAEGDTVRYPMDLDIQAAKGILGSDDIPNIKALVDQYYEANRGRDQRVKVLVILNSVMTCLRLQKVLEKAYPNEVTAIHGLVPPGSRPRDQSEFKSIVIGTSAIEVGVDFDASSLIIEAHDSSTFIQRIGRGARHGNCNASAFLPELYLPLLKENVNEGAHITPTELHSYVRLSLRDLPNYSDFPLSEYAASILLAVLINWVMKRPAGGGKLNEGEILRQVKMQLEDGSFKIPNQLKPLEKELLRICRESPGGEVFEMAKKMSCRSSFDSIPAVFTFSDSPQFDQLSLHELPKLYFRKVKQESLKERGIRIPWKMRLQQEFLEVYGIREKEAKVEIVGKVEKTYDKPIQFNFQVRSDDHDIVNEIALVLKRQPAYFLYSKKDWRLPGFPVRGGGYLVIGGDAYLAWFIRKRNGQYVD